MAPATLSPPAPAGPAPALSPYHFTPGQYQRMGDLGVFGSDRVELLEGQIVRRESMGPPHNLALDRLLRQLWGRVPPGYYLRIQQDVALANSQPQPDGAVVVGNNGDDYPDRHPGPADVALLVEVSDSTLEKDRTTKLRVYARERIPVYWIVNLVERRLEVYTDPGGPADPTYRGLAVLAEGDSVSATVGGVTLGPIAVADLLPPA